MKATINEKGELVITPTNGIENFALQQWNTAGSNPISIEKFVKKEKKAKKVKK